MSAPSNKPKSGTGRVPSSRLCIPVNETLVSVHSGDAGYQGPFSEPERAAAHAAFRAFVDSGVYPCAGAKSAVKLGAYRVGLYEPLGSPAAILHSTRDLQWFARAIDDIDARFATFIAIFHGPAPRDESAFGAGFWEQIGGMIDRDQTEYDWDETVSADPCDANFSLSLGGRAMFVVGMHPAASRYARRFPLTALAFNAHSQFAALRKEGKYPAFRNAIRRRDEALQGSSNPMLADHGLSSEAGQYDGLRHSDSWVAPIARRNRTPGTARKPEPCPDE